MEERRKNKRIDLQSKILIKRLDGDIKQEFVIEILDVSKKGIGFYYNKPLEICSLYEGDLTIWTKEVLHLFFEIVRIEKLENTILYGALFIGMPDRVTDSIEFYNTVQVNLQ